MARTNAGEASGERTRDLVLDAALEVFAAKGFRSGSLDDISQRSGVSRGALLYHFGSKQGVLTALLARRDEAVEIMRDAGPPTFGDSVSDLLATIRWRSARIRSAVDEMKLAHALEAEAADAEHPAREWVAERAARIRRHFSSHFAPYETVSRSLEGVDASTLAALTLAVIQGLETQWLIDPESIDFDRTLEAYESIIQAALRS